MMQLKKLTAQTIPENVLKQSMSRLELTWDPIKTSLFQSANNAFDIGFLGKTRPELSGIYDLKLLNEVLTEKGLQTLNDVTTSSNSTRANATTLAGNETSTSSVINNNTS